MWVSWTRDGGAHDSTRYEARTLYLVATRPEPQNTWLRMSSRNGVAQSQRPLLREGHIQRQRVLAEIRSTRCHVLDIVTSITAVDFKPNRRDLRKALPFHH